MFGLPVDVLLNFNNYSKIIFLCRYKMLQTALYLCQGFLPAFSMIQKVSFSLLNRLFLYFVTFLQTSNRQVGLYFKKAYRKILGVMLSAIEMCFPRNRSGKHIRNHFKYLMSTLYPRSTKSSQCFMVNF